MWIIEPMYPHQEARNTTAVAAVTAPAVLTATMAERVQRRVLDVFLNVSLNVSSPATKEIAAKVHAQLAHKDPAFASVIDRFQDIKCSQEISSAAWSCNVQWNRVGATATAVLIKDIAWSDIFKMGNCAPYLLNYIKPLPTSIIVYYFVRNHS